MKDAGLQEHVVLAGRVSDVADRIRNSEVFVLISYTEGMPNALIEAMVVGLAVISTDCPSGGPRHLIKNGVNGILIPPGDEAALADALERMLSNDEFRKGLGAQAYKLQEELAPERVNELWKDYFEELMRVRG